MTVGGVVANIQGVSHDVLRELRGVIFIRTRRAAHPVAGILIFATILSFKF